MTSKLKVNIIADGGDNAIMTSNGSGTLTLNNAGLKATPSFHAYRSDAWNSVPNSTWAKVPLNAEEWDTDSAYDHSTNYRFTPQVAGKYYIYGSFPQSVSIQGIYTAIYKNGSRVRYTQIDGTFGGIGIVSGLIELNGSSDYVELYVFLDGTAGATMGQDACFLGGYRLVGA
tara:strand:- start:2010 stop:2525 length:516 start_codon:yes stop_codon:yes gene_type:complete